MGPGRVREGSVTIVYNLNPGPDDLPEPRSQSNPGPYSESRAVPWLKLRPRPRTGTRTRADVDTQNIKLIKGLTLT